MVSVEYGATAGELCSLYDEYDWWRDRDAANVERALRNTDETVLLRADDGVPASDASGSSSREPSERDGAPVAAARVLTDYVYYAMVYDLIVAADRRGEGVGRELLAALQNHPRLQDVALSLLAREGLVPFYEACGFEVADDEVAHPDGDPEPLSWLVYSRE